MTTLDGAVDLARDRDLVERCQSGDETAFSDLYARYRRRLHRFCLRRLHTPDDADEAVQEAFARAWRALPRFGGDRRFYPWLSVIAANVCTDTLRRRSRLVPMQEMPARSVEWTAPDVDDDLMRGVDLAMATKALGNLSDRHQRVLQLREGTHWSAQRIADQEGLAVPAVDTLLWRARQAFKREFVALREGGGLAGVVGMGLAALRRGAARVGTRLTAWLPGPVRGPGVVAALLALSGATVVGGGALLAGSGPAAGSRAAASHGAGALASPGDAAPTAGTRRADGTGGTASPSVPGATGSGRASAGAPTATRSGPEPAVTPTAATGSVATALKKAITGAWGRTGTGGSGSSVVPPGVTPPSVTTSLVTPGTASTGAALVTNSVTTSRPAVPVPTTATVTAAISAP